GEGILKGGEEESVPNEACGGAGPPVLPDDQGAVLIDAVQNDGGRAWIVERGEYIQTRKIDEAVGAGRIGVFSDHLARAVDAVRDVDVVDVVRVDDERIAGAGFDEAELLRAVDVISGDLAQVIDALRKGFAATAGVGIVEVGVGAAAQEEAVGAAADAVVVVT